MRPIKFRAWHRGHSKMYPVKKIDFGLDGQDFGERTLALTINNGYILAATKQCDIMQFTGLLDKNGQEIYEGDILQQELYGGLKSHPQEVFWEEARFMLRPSRPYGSVLLDAYHASVKVIIGNHFANPELLEEQK